MAGSKNETDGKKSPALKRVKERESEDGGQLTKGWREDRRMK